jgi:hypothetical protein
MKKAEEMTLLLELSAPIDPALRSESLAAVAQELEANGQAGAVGNGSVHRTARRIIRDFWTPPELPNQRAPVHRGSTSTA